MSVTSDRMPASRTQRAAPARDTGRVMTGFGQDSKPLTILIIAVVVMAVLPDLVQYMNVGHSPGTFRLPRVPLSRAITYTAAAALLLASSVIVLGRGYPNRKLSGALVLLLGLIIPYVISPGLPRIETIAWVALASAVIVAVWHIGAPVRGLKWVAISGSALGTYSIILGILYPEYAMYYTQSEKALLLNWELSGPFVHSNILGVYCVLALSLIPLIVSVQWRILNGLVLCAAIVASASRTALIAAGVLALWWIVCRFRSVISVRLAGTALIGLCAATVLVLPLLSWDRSAFSGRGGIWARSLSAWQESRWVGLGIDWFTTIGTSWRYFGAWMYVDSERNSDPTPHGHNLVIDTLVRSGLVGICLLLLVLLAAIRSVRALDISSHQIACFGYLIAFLVVAITEAIWVLLPKMELFPVVGLVFAVVISGRHYGRAGPPNIQRLLEQVDMHAHNLPPSPKGMATDKRNMPMKVSGRLPLRQPKLRHLPLTVSDPGRNNRCHPFVRTNTPDEILPTLVKRNSDAGH
jgi:hypothetical protein